MEFPVFALIVVGLTGQMLEAALLPSSGLLDEMPKNCSGSHYCHEKHEDYPTQNTIDTILKKYHLLLAKPHEEVIDRQGGDVSSSICKKETKNGPIFEILDKNGNVRVVIQSNTMFQQRLTVETCLSSEPEEDSDYMESLEINNIKCYEKKINYTFLVLTRDGKGVEAINSKDGIPVCCSCRYN